MVAICLQTLLPLAAFLTAALASPIIPQIDTRQSATTCGSVSYAVKDTTNCRNAAYADYQQGSTAGSSTYPHTYNNYEGFSFPVSGPYQEFPLKKGGAYTGGSPGADRCIVNTKGQYAGAITHTGVKASGNNFVGCSGTN